MEGLPVLQWGCVFRPSPAEIVGDYLSGRVSSPFVAECPDFSGCKTEPWEIWDLYGGGNVKRGESIYLLTKRHYKKKGGGGRGGKSQFERRIGSGTWSGEKRLPVYADDDEEEGVVIGTKRMFSYERKGYPNHHHHKAWHMEEYAIKEDDLDVICAIRRISKKNNCSSTKSNTCASVITTTSSVTVQDNNNKKRKRDSPAADEINNYNMVAHKESLLKKKNLDINVIPISRRNPREKKSTSVTISCVPVRDHQQVVASSVEIINVDDHDHEESPLQKRKLVQANQMVMKASAFTTAPDQGFFPNDGHDTTRLNSTANGSTLNIPTGEQDDQPPYNIPIDMDYWNSDEFNGNYINKHCQKSTADGNGDQNQDQDQLACYDDFFQW